MKHKKFGGAVSGNEGSALLSPHCNPRGGAAIVLTGYMNTSSKSARRVQVSKATHAPKLSKHELRAVTAFLKNLISDFASADAGDDLTGAALAEMVTGRERRSLGEHLLSAYVKLESAA